MTRKERLRKLVAVQEKIKALHETRYAGFRAEAAAAEGEVATLRAAFDAPGSMSALFPEIYHRRIEGALQRAAANTALADREIAHVATQTARTNMVDRAYRSASRDEERTRGDRERLDMIARVAIPKPD